MGFLSKLFGRKKDESVDLTNAVPLGRSLRRCKKCGALCLMVGSGSFIFSSGRSTKKHDHEWVLASEQRVVDTQYNSDEVSYLKDVDNMFEGLQGLLERSSQARSIRIEILERVAELEGMIPSEPVKAHRYKAGVIYGQACAFELAAKELEKAVKLAPDNIDDKNQTAIYYFLSDNWERAQQVWEDILQ